MSLLPRRKHQNPWRIIILVFWVDRRKTNSRGVSAAHTHIWRGVPAKTLPPPFFLQEKNPGERFKPFSEYRSINYLIRRKHFALYVQGWVWAPVNLNLGANSLLYVPSFLNSFWNKEYATFAYKCCKILKSNMCVGPKDSTGNWACLSLHGWCFLPLSTAPFIHFLSLSVDFYAFDETAPLPVLKEWPRPCLIIQSCPQPLAGSQTSVIIPVACFIFRGSQELRVCQGPLVP